MNRSFYMLLAIGIVAVSATSAVAGGFSRGRADTDVLYEKGNFDARFTGTYVMPSRQYSTIGGVAATDGAYSNNYFVPNLGAKVGFSDNIACAITYTQPFGASSTYGAQAIAKSNAVSLLNGTKSTEFKTDEIGGTCALSTTLGMGRAYVIGGVFQQKFDYTEVAGWGTLKLSDSGQTGYRIGAAYAIDEYALRAEVMYRSQIDHVASGTFVTSAVLQGINGTPTGTVVPSTGKGSMPQSVRIALQSGVAPDWLVYGSVEWTQWSVLQQLNYFVGTSPKSKTFNYQDGWTVQAGVGHKFNDTVSGTVNLTWDRGVGTGVDIMTDTWTLGTGVSIKAGPGDLRLGAGVSYLTSGSQTGAVAGTYAATADANWAYGITGSYMIKF